MEDPRPPPMMTLVEPVLAAPASAIRRQLKGSDAKTRSTGSAFLVCRVSSPRARLDARRNGANARSAAGHSLTECRQRVQVRSCRRRVRQFGETESELRQYL